MSTPSLLKRLEAIEGIQNPTKPAVLWKPYDWDADGLAGFNARFAAVKATHPGRPVMLFSGEDPQ